jgi:glycosyltransferase involved in cell wall biosynthesis
LILLEAFRIFKEKNENDFILVISGGKGWKSESFFQALKNHAYREQICVTGFVENEDLPTLYSQAAAFIYPSLYEGFGLPIIEAMSCGTPVIAANNSSLTESGGNLTHYFDANNAEALSLLMTEVSADKTQREALSIRLQNFTKKFDWDEFAIQAWKLLSK